MKIELSEFESQKGYISIYKLTNSSGASVELSSLGMYYAFVLILTVLSLLIFNYPDKRYKKLFIVLIVLASIVSTITINPITKAHYADFMKYNEKNKNIEIKVEK